MPPPASEHETDRAVRRVRTIVPWVVSIGVHAGLIGVGFLVTWTVIVISEDEASLVEAEFYNLEHDPLVVPESGMRQDDQTHSASVEQLVRRAESASGVEVAPLSMVSDAAAPSAAAFSSAPGDQSASFMGVRTTDARHIVYLIDASGSMIPAMDVVLDELARSLSALTERQTFAVLFFQDGQAIAAPPGDRLVPATEPARQSALAWIRENVIPQGRSDPTAAIEKALGMAPDVIFLLSENITGAGRFEIDRDALLGRLEELNPAGGDGRRPARINCVQFLSRDPLETLRRIAERHGSRGGYRFLEPAELGLAAP